MEYIYAALLLHRLGKELTEENIKKVVKATGVEPDEVKVKALVAALNEINIDEALKTAVAMPVTAAPPAEEEKEEVKKEEKEEEEKKEEEALEGLAALFG